jgi:hypothetical protein
MLFSALADKAFGSSTSRNQADEDSLYPASVFFKEYPSLFPLLHMELKRAVSILSKENTLPPLLYPIMSILARLKPTIATDTSYPLNEYYDLVKQCTLANDWKVREIQLKKILEVLKCATLSNMKHGYALIARHLVSSIVDKQSAMIDTLEDVAATFSKINWIFDVNSQTIADAILIEAIETLLKSPRLAETTSGTELTELAAEKCKSYFIPDVAFNSPIPTRYYTAFTAMICNVTVDNRIADKFVTTNEKALPYILKGLDGVNGISRYLEVTSSPSYLASAALQCIDWLTSSKKFYQPECFRYLSCHLAILEEPECAKVLCVLKSMMTTLNPALLESIVHFLANVIHLYRMSDKEEPIVLLETIATKWLLEDCPVSLRREIARGIKLIGPKLLMIFDAPLSLKYLVLLDCIIQDNDESVRELGIASASIILNEKVISTKCRYQRPLLCPACRSQGSFAVSFQTRLMQQT